MEGISKWADSRSSVLCTVLTLLSGVLFSACPQSAAAAAESLLPPHKKWKMVFQDEFDGKTLDTTKWSFCPPRPGMAFCWNGAKGIWDDDHAGVDGNGHFVVKVTRDADGAYRYHAGARTKGKFQRTYGYFETRARFTREPGWWGAVWLYGVEVGPNPFVMGQEIDMFEDYPKPKKSPEFTHNIHFDSQLGYASENDKRVGELEGNSLHSISRGKHVAVDDWNAFHVIGVEWTPLEYVFYCDGKETFRLNYREVPVTTQPMCIWISGCFRDPNRSKDWMGDYADGKWPDSLMVDYVRVYEEDTDGRARPSVTLQLEPSVRVVRPDDDVTFRVTASADGAAVTNLCLFSNGRIRAEKAAPLALFTLSAKRLYTGENILIAMACDSKGLIGQSAPVMLEVKSSEADNHRPYRNKAQVIPGRITPGHYDEGGQGVAYFTYLKQNIFRKPAWDLTFRTDEGINAPNENGIGAFRSMWVIYTVDVEKTGRYRVAPCLARVAEQAFPSDKKDKIVLECDGKPLADFVFGTDYTTGKNWWDDFKPLPEKTVFLTEGRHVLRVMFDASPFQFGGLTFTWAE